MTPLAEYPHRLLQAPVGDTGQVQSAGGLLRGQEGYAARLRLGPQSAYRDPQLHAQLGDPARTQGRRPAGSGKDRQVFVDLWLWE